MSASWDCTCNCDGKRWPRSARGMRCQGCGEKIQSRQDIEKNVVGVGEELYVLQPELPMDDKAPDPEPENCCPSCDALLPMGASYCPRCDDPGGKYPTDPRDY